MADNNEKKAAESKEAENKEEKKNAASENKEDGKEKAAEKPADGKEKAGDKPEDDKKDLLDDDEAGDLILEHQRESLPLTRENAVFTRSKGNLISLKLTKPDGEIEEFERVVVMRAFPISNPDEFLSVREPDSKRTGHGHEIGMIRHMSDFDDPTQKLFKEELDRRYFSPKLIKIISVKDKFGYLYWDAETSSGHATFIMNNPFSNIRVLDDGRIIMHDIDGNVFEIPDAAALDKNSYKKIEIYL